MDNSELKGTFKNLVFHYQLKNNFMVAEFLRPIVVDKE